MNCESCVHYQYDEDYGEFICMVDMDEDEYLRLLQQPRHSCPYFRDGDDYLLARRQ